MPRSWYYAVVRKCLYLETGYTVVVERACSIILHDGKMTDPWVNFVQRHPW